LSSRLSFALPSLGVTVPRINALISADVIRLSSSRFATQSISASAGTALPCFAGTLYSLVGGRAALPRPPRYPFSQQNSQALDVKFTALRGPPPGETVSPSQLCAPGSWHQRRGFRSREHMCNLPNYLSSSSKTRRRLEALRSALGCHFANSCSLPVIEQNLSAGLTDFCPICLETAKDRKISLRNHLSTVPLHVARTRPLFLRGATLSKHW
jgi:hypothetical protein